MSEILADLTYRGYDGPLEPPSRRWWVIAKSGMRLATKKRGFWVWSVLSAYWYLILGAIFYFMDTLGSQISPQGGNPLLSQVKWNDQFLTSFSISQLLLFILALLIGIGSIASDNRSKALLVYLSKPCTKLDYVLGKWMAIFLPLLLIIATPMLIFYFYCAMSFGSYGFGNYPGLLLKLILLTPVTAAFHASVCVGVSSLFDQPRLAGAAYAGVYFVALSFTKMMQVLAFLQHHGGRHGNAIGAALSDLPQTLYYASIDGIQIGIAKIILGTDGSSIIPNPNSDFAIPAPNPVLAFGVYFGLCALGIAVAWSRVRAVEVVRG